MMVMNSDRGNHGVCVSTERLDARANRKRFHQQSPLTALALSPIRIPKLRAAQLRRKNNMSV